MGQYYTPIIKRENGGWSGFLCYDYDNGAKLMEHSYVGNCLVETVVKQLLEKPGHLAWVGDYSKIGDVKSNLANEFIQKERKYSSNSLKYSKPKIVNDMENSSMVYLINHTKQEYVNMREYFKKVPLNNEYGSIWIIHPLPLLTAIGNGKGGGDYRGTCEEMIGYWACDLIEVGWLDEKTKNYVNITSEVMFNEG